MSPKKSSCILCTKPKKVFADKKQWAIHLAIHREDMIKYLVDNFKSCVLCAYPKEFEDKSTAASHLRWAHKRKALIDWVYQNLLVNENTN